MNLLVLILIIMVIALSILFYLTKKELQKIKKRFEDVIDLDLEKEKISNTQKKLEINIEKLKNEINNLKEKSLELINIRENLKKEIVDLEEDKEFQEFSIYKPKFFYEHSETYKKEIKKINTMTKEMIKNKSAALCTTVWNVNGNVTQGRKMTNDNLKIMLRAFNGEADSAIAKVKYNNINIMENRIKKSFEILNKLNKVNACFITSEYLNLKIQELYLNFEMSNKLNEEKEEIRQAREEDRENQKAQKEFEKVQKEFEKEEKRTKLALQKAEDKLKNLHGEEIHKMNEKIQQLKEELEEAKKNKEKATSMAQLTKAGHVYVISNIGSFGGNVYKIGMTRRLEPLERVKELGSASVPFNFDVHAMIYSKNAPDLENILHKAFYDNRVNKTNNRKEFFKVDLNKIEEVARKYNPDIDFTTFAAAEQYRETLVIENNNNNFKNINENLINEKNFIINI